MLSWDEFDNEDGEVAAKGNTPAQAAAAATIDKPRQRRWCRRSGSSRCYRV